MKKIFSKLWLFTLIFFLFIFWLSSCENSKNINKYKNNKNLDLFSEENQDILSWKFLNEKDNFWEIKENKKNKNIWLDLNLEDVKWWDLFNWAEFDDEENNLWANILNNWVFWVWSVFYSETWVDLREVSGEISFSSWWLAPEYWDKILWLKIAFANNSSFWIFDSVSYWDYWMEDVSSENWKVWFKIFIDSKENSWRKSKFLDLFTKEKDFKTQIKFSELKKEWNKYTTKRIHSLVVDQVAKNEEWWTLFNWKCLTSDFTYNKDEFKDNWEIFWSNFYEKTNTWYKIDDLWNWDSNWVVLTSTWLCAFNDTYNFIKWWVVTWSQCWEWENSWWWKKDVWKLVFRTGYDSFCTQTPSVKEELHYPKYACNIKTEKTWWSLDTQKYLWWDEFSLNWSKYTCWK